MTVKELISALEKFAPDLEVLCCTEDEALLPAGHGARLLHIEGVDACDAEKRRGFDTVPSMAFGKSDLSQKHVLIDVTSEF